MKYEIEPVAIVRNNRKEAEDDNWLDYPSEIELLKTMPSESILGLESFSHIEIIFLFHLVSADRIVQSAEHPRENPDWPRVGIFAQRKKSRPNRLGCTICTVQEVQERTIIVNGLDAIDGTPVIDIKPVMREFLPQSVTDVQQPAWSSELMRNYW